MAMTTLKELETTSESDSASSSSLEAPSKERFSRPSSPSLSSLPSTPHNIHGYASGHIPPDGGLHAWLNVLSGFLCNFCSFGFLNACGVFQYYYETDLLKGHSSSSITWITTMQMFLMFALGPVIQVLVEAVGPRKVVVTSSVISLLGIFSLSISRSYYQVFLAQGVCFGLGSAGLFLPGVGNSQNWFSTRRGLASGLVSSGSSLGGVVFPIIFIELSGRGVGFPEMVRWMGGFMGLCLLVACVTVSGAFPAKGLEKVKQEREEKKKRALLSSPSITKQTSKGADLYTTPPVLIFMLGSFLTFFGLFTPCNYLPLMASSQPNFPPTLALYTPVFQNAFSIFGRILPAWLSDRFGALNITSIVSLCAAISLLALWLPLELITGDKKAGILVFAAVYGFFAAGFASLLAPCATSISEGNMDKMQLRLSVFFAALGVGALTGLPVMGAAYDRDRERGRGFEGLIVGAGVIMVVGSGCVAVVAWWGREWERQRRRRFVEARDEA